MGLLLIGTDSAIGEGLLMGASPEVIVASPADPATRHLSWPKIVRAGNGTLILGYSAGVGHNRGGSGLAISLSKDDGQTFTSPKLLCYYPRDDARYRDVGNLALGVGKDGVIILLAMAYNDDKANTILGWISQDHGETWKRTDTSAIGENRTGSVFGHVFQVQGKGMAVCGHYRKPRGTGLWIAYSTDNGTTWGSPQTLSERAFFEPVFVHSDNEMIGLVRENAARAYHQFVSRDLGKHWTLSEKATQSSPKAVHPSPFITTDPAHPERLLALVSERTPVNQITLWETRSGTLKWRRVGLVAEGGGDWTYPWMTHLGGKDWFLVYYQGTKDEASILGSRITVPDPGRD